MSSLLHPPTTSLEWVVELFSRITPRSFRTPNTTSFRLARHPLAPTRTITIFGTTMARPLRVRLWVSQFYGRFHHIDPKTDPLQASTT